MSTTAKQIFEIRCDFPGCNAALESDYSGPWLYDSPAEARSAAEGNYDWLTNVDGKDYCYDHTTSDDDGNTIPDQSDGDS